MEVVAALLVKVAVLEAAVSFGEVAVAVAVAAVFVTVVAVAVAEVAAEEFVVAVAFAFDSVADLHRRGVCRTCVAAYPLFCVLACVVSCCPRI